MSDNEKRVDVTQVQALWASILEDVARRQMEKAASETALSEQTYPKTSAA